MNDYLYSLIVELDRQERLHITNTLKSNKKNTILLNFFSYLCDQKKFDEKHIKASIQNKTLQKFYPQYKRKLYDAILKAMRQYNKSQPIEKKLYDQLKDITFLFEKGRINEAFSLIEKGQKVAKKHQVYELELLFLKWKLLLTSKVGSLTTKKKTFNDVQARVNICLKTNEGLFLNRLKHYTYLFEKKNTLINLPPQKRSIASKNLLKKLDIQMDINNSSEINYGYHLLHYQIYLLENNLVKVKFHLEKAVSIIEEKTNKTIRDYHNYVIGLANLIEIAFLNRNIKEMDKYLSNLIEVDKKYGKNVLIRPLTRNYIPLFQLHYDILTNQNSNEKPIQKVEFQIENEQNENNVRSSLCLAAATHYWLQKNYSKALDYILIFKDFQNQSINFYAYKFLELIIYYELKEYQLLDSKTRSIYRYLSEQDQYNKVERAVLKAVKKGIHAKNKEETKEIIRQLVNFIKTSEHDSNIISLRYIYFEEWFEAELSGESVQDIFKKQLVSVPT
ncbi:MAG: hypothetical protein R2728_05205 [Chitinophagales bacterium]